MEQAAPLTFDTADGGALGVLRCLAARRDAALPSALAVVWDIDGSAYVEPGTLLLFGESGRLRGWLSGGCLEQHVEARARALLASAGTAEWIELDQRDDEALLGPSASGCRGRLRLLLLGAEASADVTDLVTPWMQGSDSLHLAIEDGALRITCANAALRFDIPPAPWPEPGPRTLRLPAPRRVLLAGAGAESPLLMPLLRALGWRIDACEQRPRWLPLVLGADRLVQRPPAEGLAELAPATDEPVLVMHHDFERDRAALVELAGRPPRWIGLLGPRRRRDDLFKLLTADAAESLRPRLQAPVGLDLGGKGPAAIALSIAAWLQQLRHAG